MYDKKKFLNPIKICDLKNKFRTKNKKRIFKLGSVYIKQKRIIE